MTTGGKPSTGAGKSGFDPFASRVSRDIRNQLAEAFLDALASGDRTGFARVSEALKQRAPDPAHKEFIRHRTRRCLAVLDLPDPGPETDLDLGFRLFSLHLYYECHEWLERFWRTLAQGPEKKGVQALIRTAGALALQEAGQEASARTTAQKALALLDTYQAHLPAPFRASDMRGQLTLAISLIP